LARQQFKGVLAACLCGAFDQLSKDGRQILKAKAGEEETNTKDNEKDSENPNTSLVKHKALHSLAFATKRNGNGNGNGIVDDSLSSVTEKKSASSWNLDDARSWLLEASRRIARKWKQQESNQDGDAISKAAIPHGSTEEIEGKLVAHTLTLCDLMEIELKNDKKSSAVRRSKQTVVTPRVAMGRLGIKWQHSHERGSGGAGGVGNSGLGDKNTGQGRIKTAGQILILKSAKRLGQAIKDTVAGEAFHCEVRALLQRQENMAKKKRSNENIMRQLKKRRRKLRK